MIGVRQAGLLGLLAVGLIVAAPRAGAGDFLPVGPVVPSGASFDDAVAAGDLAEERAGDFDVTSSVVTSQNQNAEHSGNTIGGDAPAGSVFIAEGAMGEMHGMGQYVVNTGNLGTAQGNMTMTIILNPPPSTTN